MAATLNARRIERWTNWAVAVVVDLNAEFRCFQSKARDSAPTCLDVGSQLLEVRPRPALRCCGLTLDGSGSVRERMRLGTTDGCFNSPPRRDPRATRRASGAFVRLSGPRAIAANALFAMARPFAGPRAGTGRVRCHVHPGDGRNQTRHCRLRARARAT